MFIIKHYLILLSVILIGLDANSQNTNIPFYSHTYTRNVDYHSFPSMLMLKHRIGNFYKLPKNPVLTPSGNGWDRKDVADPFVLVTADTVYLFYDGSSGGRYGIGYAVRDPEGWLWIKRGEILKDENSNWDSYHRIAPGIVRVGDQWRLYYSGNDSDSEFGYQIGMAVSEGYGKWQVEEKNPIMTIDSTDWDFAGNIYCDNHYFPESGKFRMWYTGFQGPLSGIGLAESEDGYNWQKIGEAPVFNVFPGVIAPEVIYDGERYFMFFAQLALTGEYRTRICRAESNDGIQWQNIEDVLIPTEKWEGSKLMKPNLSFFEQRMHLYYCSQKGSNWHIGEATADAIFEQEGIWRSKEMSERVSQIQIKFEQPEGTSVHANIIEMKSGRKIAIPISDQAHLLRKDVFSMTHSDIDVEGSWQIELELQTKIENRSPVIYQIGFN